MRRLSTELLRTCPSLSCPIQVRVATLPLVISSLADCMATKHYDQHEELWRAAARAMCAIIPVGLPAINQAALAAGSFAGAASPSRAGSSSSNTAQAMDSASAATVTLVEATWCALSRTFQMFLLQAGLPPLVQASATAAAAVVAAAAAAVAAAAAAAAAATPADVPTAPVNSYERGGGAAAAAASVAAAAAAAAATAQSDAELQSAVLDCLADSVLPASGGAPPAVRVALVAIIQAGTVASLQHAVEGAGAPSGRFSHACLSKLYVLCSRGSDAAAGPASGLDPLQQQSALVQLEVARVALPLFVSR